MNAKDQYYENLVYRLCQLDKETEWVEFKVNNGDPNLIGECISAIRLEKRK